MEYLIISMDLSVGYSSIPSMTSGKDPLLSLLEGEVGTDCHDLSMISYLMHCTKLAYTKVETQMMMYLMTLVGKARLLLNSMSDSSNWTRDGMSVSVCYG